MNRFARSLFAVLSVSLAVLMLIVAVILVRKNTPREFDAEARYLPPTSPATAISARQSPGNSYIGGVGIIEPVGEAIVIGSQLPGVVEEVCVAPGAKVRQGELLLRLDRRSAFADLRVAEADLAAQQAKLTELVGQIEIQRARLDAAQALFEQSKSNEDNFKREFDRALSIGSSNALSQEELDTRRSNWETAKAKSHESSARVDEAKANLALLVGTPIAATMEVQKAAVAQAQANLERAQVNLDLRSILAPKDATVLSVKIRVGEFIPASILATPLVTLGVIDPLHVRVDIDESEIPRFDPQANAFASVRGRPDVRVPLEYLRTEPFVIPKRSLTGTVSERVDTRVLQVIYRVAPSAIQATVGQQVDVYIEDVAERSQ